MGKPTEHLPTRTAFSEEWFKNLGTSRRIKTPLDRSELESILGSRIPDDVLYVLELLPDKYNAHFAFRMTSISLRKFQSILRRQINNVEKSLSGIEAMSPHPKENTKTAMLDGATIHEACIDRDEDLICHLYSETTVLLRRQHKEIEELIQKCAGATGKFLFRHSEDSLSSSAYEAVVKIYIATLKLNKISTSTGRSAVFSPSERLLHAAFPREAECEIDRTASSYRHIHGKLSRAWKA